MGPVLVFGHKKPDNDSICSAVAYAHLKNIVDAESVYVPVRLGPAPNETRWAFERFGLELPEEIEHVHTRVRDVMTEHVHTISPDEPMLGAGRLMREHDVRALPVVDGDGKVAGLVSQRMLAERYLEETEISGFGEVPVSLGRLVRVLDAELLVGEASMQLAGSVLIGAMEPETVASLAKPGDALIVGNRVRTQPLALEAGVSCLIVTGGHSPAREVLALAAEKGAAVMVTANDTYSTARLVSLARAVGDLMETDALYLSPETLLSEAAEDLLGSHHREAVVLDDDGHCVGILTRTNIARGIRRRVVLVDHNEAAQSAAGVEDASVVEIVDHHRVGDIQTAGPILFLNLPVGSTATIVASRYEDLGIDVPPPIAGILLCAVLTDTVLLKSPTTTHLDREVVDRLSAIAQVDPAELGMQLFRSRSAGEEFSAERVLRTDVKEYRVGDLTTAIAQYEAVDLAPVMERAQEVRAAMELMREQRGYDLVVLMATDVMREGSEIFAVGKTRLIERALHISLVDGSAWLPGVLSRKKQVAAMLVEVAGV